MLRDRLISTRSCQRLKLLVEGTIENRLAGAPLTMAALLFSTASSASASRFSVICQGAACAFQLARVFRGAFET